MTDTIITQSEAVLVAIDIAKSRHEVLLQIPGTKRRRRFTILNKLDDFNRLIAILMDYGCTVRMAVIRASRNNQLPIEAAQLLLVARARA
ncbi:hypothetical protein [Ruegeria sp. HKCCD7255]|uniref:hypothetical protein n=1 Tax=Ruegeria sp. HKCCD7255 TaxID=2683004 RepID=UPI0035305172